MAKPAGLQSKLKDNSNKKYREHADWEAGKKVGRKKQRWVWDQEPLTVTANDGSKSVIPNTGFGHWEKV